MSNLAQLPLPTETAAERPHVQPSALYAQRLAVLIVLVGMIVFGACLDRLRGFYDDDVVFAFPALQAAQGGAFAYPGGPDAPFVNEVWAYHGPVLPNLEYLIFKVAGFSQTATRLPDFLGAWLAALTLVVFLRRRGYPYGALCFAILWCGDRAVIETMVGRMEGLAMFTLAILFVLLDATWHSGKPRLAFFSGAVAGLCVLIHPLCAVFVLASLLLVACARGLAGSLRFIAGGLINLPLLLVLWHLHPIKSWIQFRHVARNLNKITGLTRLSRLLHMLSWSRFWLIGLVLLTVISAAAVLLELLRKRRLGQLPIELILAAGFSTAGLLLMARSSLFPYYVSYFSIWPILLTAMLTERCRWFRPAALLLALLWLPSAAWNLMRIREVVKFHSALTHAAVIRELAQDVPRGAAIATSSELYAVPIEAGYSNRKLVWFDPRQQDVCPDCYLLITRLAYDQDFVLRSNLDRRTVLYQGPAFPGSGPLGYPVLIFSPERAKPRTR